MSTNTLRQTFAMVLLLLLQHLLLHCVVGGWPSKMDQQDKARLQSILSGRMAIPSSLKLFVKYKNGRGRRLAKSWAERKKFKKHIKNLKVVSIVAKNRTSLDVLSASKDIVYVELQHKVHALLHSKEDHHIADERLSFRRLRETVEYGVSMVQADQLWDLPPPTGNKTTICVVDSGYALGHPDLPDQTNNVSGFSLLEETWFHDGYGHGTHCAGTIGAIGDNNVGVAGVIKDPDLFNFYIGKVLDDDGDGYEDDFVTAIERCVDSGAKVISMSLGAESYSETIQTACKDAYGKGVLLVAAAGNDGITPYKYPASLPQVMSVVAVDSDMKIASFSQYNDQVEIAAPGVDIVSTIPEANEIGFGYSAWSGTSMATPYVSGVAALVWSYFPQCNSSEIRNALLRTAKHPDNLGCSEDMGFGIVQAKAAYDLLVAGGCTAGGYSSTPVGGCRQDPSHVPPPTPAPTPFTCDETVLKLVLKTDKWGEETSWDLQNSRKMVVGSGSQYRREKQYVEWLCLPPDEYTFTIRDTEGDGICCEYGKGHFSIQYDGVLIKQGGRFSGEEVVRIPRTIVDFLRGCSDSNSWTFTTSKGKKKDCKYLGALPLKRCKLEGIDQKGNVTSGYDSCPLACGSCTMPPRAAGDQEKPTGSPTQSPTNHPTSLPTPLPTLSPTSSPTPAPTSSPTPFPTALPTVPPTLRPTFSPTPQPTLSPTHYPTKHPTLSPTSPTPRPTARPTFSPTRRPSPRPTPSPTPRPTEREIDYFIVMDNRGVSDEDLGLKAGNRVKLSTGRMRAYGWYSVPTSSQLGCSHQDFWQGNTEKCSRVHSSADVTGFNGLGNQELHSLVGKCCAALVYKGDLKIKYSDKYSPNNGYTKKLKNRIRGQFAFCVDAVQVPKASSTSLFDVWITVRDPPAYAPPPFTMLRCSKTPPRGISKDKAQCENGQLQFIFKIDNYEDCRGSSGRIQMTLSMDNGSNKAAVDPEIYEVPMTHSRGEDYYRYETSIPRRASCRDYKDRKYTVSTNFQDVYSDLVKNKD